MRAEIVAVGTELLLGQIVNTNAQFLSRRLAELGIDVYYQTVVGDNKERLIEAIRMARGRAELIVFTGGLGPTMDDLTRDALAEFLGLGIAEHEPSMEKIRAMFAGRGTAFIESNRRQAHLLEGATPLRNDTGLAVGNALSSDGTLYLLLPGPPREMKPMFDNDGQAWLLEKMGATGEDGARTGAGASKLHSVMIKFAGIGESGLEDALIDLIREQTDPTIATYASEGEVTLRLSTKAGDNEEAGRRMEPVLTEIRRRLGDYLFAEDDVTLEAAVVRLLTQSRRTLAMAESCTGGMVSQFVTMVPGSADAFLGGVVSYSNGAKRGLLGVPASLLEGDGAPGAVSEETAAAMAKGVCEALDADFGVSVTGVAGPASSEGKPVGLVFVGASERGGATRVERLQLLGDREGVRLRAAKRALYLLWKVLTGRA